ncbi:MAG: carboxymuconolactone decarboxylase family protein [Desulfovibrionaceae bacterium]|nr:carboxymuconolactone decarboxylase family protein [Desulfovibrionaceae bacterium]
MALTEKARQYQEKYFPNMDPTLAQTDPEFVELFHNFAFDEVANQNDLDPKTRYMAILATLLGCQGVDEFKIELSAALKAGLTPVEIKEIVYQATAYLGFGRVRPFLTATNEVFKQAGIALPLPGQATTTRENRREKGTQAQVEIFGDRMQEFWKSGPEESRHINYWLAANCFGDYYTRTGLNLKQREMITFCYISAQGGCEPQLTAHCKGNFKVGNDKAFLIKVLSQCLPYIGYPRSLNALRCINEAAKD